MKFNPVIGVFDSGIGGQTLVPYIKQQIPGARVIYRSDPEHLPYGDKTPEQIFSYVRTGAHALVNQGCELIVLACNTATTNAVSRLRVEFKIPFVGVEPAVKPAARLTKSDRIAVLATRATLNSPSYKRLKQDYAKGVKVLDIDCTSWVMMIESGEIDRRTISEVTERVHAEGADVIVLGSTHFHHLEKLINHLVGDRVVVLQASEAIAKQAKRLIEAEGVQLDTK